MYSTNFQRLVFMMGEEINPSLPFYLLPDQPESQPIAAAIGVAFDAFRVPS